MPKAPGDPVADEELLYRRVKARLGYTVLPDGKVVFSQSAFNDKGDRPSVDRADLNGHNPEKTKLEPSDGVTSLVAARVREKTFALGDKKQHAYVLDVIQDPIIPDNPAHALIVANPRYRSGEHFKKIKEALARLASETGWTLMPEQN